MNTTIKHLLTGNELSTLDIHSILNLAEKMKANPALYTTALSGKHVALVFEKPSLRTRFSFTAAVSQLGGHVIESVGQNRKTEQPKDFIRVIQGYCAAMMIRTYDDNDLSEMQAYANIPIINGLTDTFHPCQSLADLLTLKEHFKQLEGLTICYLGDANNVLNSLCIMATKLGVNVHYCCPESQVLHENILNTLQQNGTASLVTSFQDPKMAVQGCHAVYTDVWTSMGFAEQDETIFAGLQVNEELMDHAHKNALFMHCMPMVRGKEVSMNLPDMPCSVIFQQSENRLHVQKSLLAHLIC